MPRYGDYGSPAVAALQEELLPRHQASFTVTAAAKAKAAVNKRFGGALTDDEPAPGPAALWPQRTTPSTPSPCPASPSPPRSSTNDGAARRPVPRHEGLRHRVREHWREWRRIAARRGRVMRWVLEGMYAGILNRRPSSSSSSSSSTALGVSLHDATDAQLRWWAEESSRLVRVGALKPGATSRYVSKVFLVPKHDGNNWRHVIDLRQLNYLYCAVYTMRFETLWRFRYLVCRGDLAFSFDL
eukprot:jgi/Tetstr1/434931/TSEL_023928.t1